MPITLQNALPTLLDIPGAGLVFAPGEAKTVESLTPALSNAVRRGVLTLVSQTAASLVEVAEDGQTHVALPLPWLGPDQTRLALNGLVLNYGVDFTVEASANTLTWLDAEITLKAGDRFTVIGGGG